MFGKFFLGFVLMTATYLTQKVGFGVLHFTGSMTMAAWGAIICFLVCVAIFGFIWEAFQMSKDNCSDY